LFLAPSSSLAFHFHVSLPALGFLGSCRLTTTAIWVKMWAEYNEKHPNKRLGFYLGIYSMLGALSFGFLGVSCWQVILLRHKVSG
jgi:hypothetical protein